MQSQTQTQPHLPKLLFAFVARYCVHQLKVYALCVCVCLCVCVFVSVSVCLCGVYCGKRQEQGQTESLGGGKFFSTVSKQNDIERGGRRRRQQQQQRGRGHGGAGRKKKKGPNHQHCRRETHRYTCVRGVETATPTMLCNSCTKTSPSSSCCCCCCLV